MRSFPAFSHSASTALLSKRPCLWLPPVCSAHCSFHAGGCRADICEGGGFGSGAASLGFGSHTGGFAPASKPIRITMPSLCYALLHFIGHAARIPQCCTVGLCTNASMTMELLGEDRSIRHSWQKLPTIILAIGACCT